MNHVPSATATQPHPRAKTRYANHAAHIDTPTATIRKDATDAETSRTVDGPTA